MSTQEINSTQPSLSVIQGGGKQSQPGLLPKMEKGDKIFAGASLAALAVTGTFAAAENHVIINTDSQSPQEKKALEVKMAAKQIDTLKHNGQSYTVKVKTGDSPSGLADKYEPEAHRSSTVLSQAQEADISSQSPNGIIQTGQDVEIADFADGQVEVPNNIIAPVNEAPEQK